MKTNIFLITLVLFSVSACKNELANKKESKKDINQKQNKKIG